MPCNARGEYLHCGAPPAPRLEPHDFGDWTPWRSRGEFELAEFLYAGEQMSNGNTDKLLRILDSHFAPIGAPFANHKELHSQIDAIRVGDVPWQSFSCRYKFEGTLTDLSPSWMRKEYKVHFRDPLSVIKNILADKAFVNTMDYAPYLEYNANGLRQYHDFMSANWAYREAVRHYICFTLIPRADITCSVE